MMLTMRLFSLQLAVFWICVCVFHCSDVAGFLFKSSSEESSSSEEESSSEESPERFCNSTNRGTYKTPCDVCRATNTTCPEDSIRTTDSEGIPCTYFNMGSITIKLDGCQHICEMSITVRECCTGYWGNDCQDCPGGADNPCSGHGECSDGIEGTGSCTCQPEFSGTACERCNEGRYGSDCSQECRCERGVCNDGISGDGSCDCNSGFKGILCDQVAESCAMIVCSEYSRCVDPDGTGAQCECLHGYKEVNTICQPINPCEDANPCDASAVCVQSGAGDFHCKCQWGHEGDGFICTPIDPCQTNYGSCSEDTTLCMYDEPGKSHCICRDGYENYMETTGCSLIDMCIQDTSLCHKHANCTTVGPGDAQCICPDGYVGDGNECFGNIIQRVQDRMDEGDQLAIALQLMMFAYPQALAIHGPFTIFVPTDGGFLTGLNKYQRQQMTTDVNYARFLLRQHILPRQLTVEDMRNSTTLYTLQGSTAMLYYKRGQLSYKLHGFNGRARVLYSDIVAVNGIIHIVNQLMDKPPNIVGSAKRPITEVMYADSAYSILETLLKTVELDTIIKEGGPWTIFAPSNVAWAKLPQGTVKYLRSDEGQHKLKALLLNHIIQPPVMTATDLVNTHRFLSIGHMATTVEVTANGQIRLNGEVNITQSDIHANNGYIHHIDGLLLPDALKPILPHRCDLLSHRLVRGTCGHCASELHCPAKEDIPVGKKERGCRFWVNLGKTNGGYKPLIGCRQMCNKTYTAPRCCANFYGSECLPCPGGFQNPCYGRGKCFDGYQGSGYCTCNDSYYGTTCQLCQARNKYGPNCTSSCTCLHGLCDNRVVGSSGICRPNTCYRGYIGSKCDVQKKKCTNRLRCHAHAECVRITRFNMKDMIRIMNNLPSRMMSRRAMKKLRKSVAYCKCKQGYTGPGSHCVEIDPCEADDRGGCHSQALCIKTSPGLSRCQCDSGYVGDGFYCYPSTTCNSSLECDDNARCVYLRPGEFQCACQHGFHGNGTYCVMNDVCQKNNGGCHPKSRCVATGPGQANCTCPEGLGGDGLSCFGDLVYELTNHPQLTTLHELLSSIPYKDSLLTDLNTNYTLLAPNNSVIEDFIRSAPRNFFKDEGNLQILSGFHLLPDAVTKDELRTNFAGKNVYTMADEDHFSLNISVIGEDVYINDAMIIQADILALNGYIHIIDQVLEPYPISEVPQTLQQLLELNPDFSTTLSYLHMYDMIEFIEEMESYTFFVPDNYAWTQYKKPVTRRLLLYMLLPDILMTWEIQDGVQILYSMLDNSVNHKLKFTVSDNNQVFLNEVLLIKQTSNMLTMGGVAHGISDIPHVDLNQCDVMVDHTNTGECGPCDSNLLCPEGYLPITPKPVMLSGNCTYSVTRLVKEDIVGCQQLCHRYSQDVDCCSGYFGQGCTECPGDANEPCHNHGNCSDGLDGDGLCTCYAGYVGDSCDECNTEECLNDPCLNNNGGCHTSATCYAEPDNDVMCTCMLGYAGDGSICQPMCEVNNGGCDVSSDCNVDNDGNVSCSCPDNQPLDGSACQTRECNTNNGGCSYNAICTDTGRGSVMCHCLAGYVGNGTMCNRDMWTTLLSLPQTNIFDQVIQNHAVQLVHGLSWAEFLQDEFRNVTVFVPLHLGQKQNLRPTDLERYICEQWIGLYPTTQTSRTSYVAIDGSMLSIDVSTTNSRATYTVNGIVVVEANIPVTNGMLHLLDGPFLTTPQALQQVPKTQRKFPLVVGGILGGTIVIILLILVVWKKRNQARLLINRMRQNRTVSFTFARFDSDHFNFVRFMRGSRGEETNTEDSVDCTPDDKDNSHVGTSSAQSTSSSFNNPIFNQSTDGEEDQLIFT